MQRHVYVFMQKRFMFCHSYFVAIFIIISGLNVQSSTMDSSTYVPPLPQEEEDELEHYRLQVKIMADIINVSLVLCESEVCSTTYSLE